MGCQPPIVVQCDNTTNDTVKPKRTKAMDMSFCNRVQQGQFKIQWDPGIDNKADYFTKHFLPSYHQQIRPTYLHLANHMALLEREGVWVNEARPSAYH